MTISLPILDNRAPTNPCKASVHTLLIYSTHLIQFILIPINSVSYSLFPLLSPSPFSYFPILHSFPCPIPIPLSDPTRTGNPPNLHPTDPPSQHCTTT